MFVFGSKKTPLGVTMALLVVCFSICPHSGYPYAEEDEDPMAPKDKLDNEEDPEFIDDDDEAFGEEQASLEESADVENASSSSLNCAGEYQSCKFLPCCGIRTCKKKDTWVTCEDPDAL